MKTFIAMALIVSSIYATAQSPSGSSMNNTGIGTSSTGANADTEEHADGAVVDKSTTPITGTSINKQKMEDADLYNDKVKDTKKVRKERKIDSSDNMIDQAN
jgi:hypothetical protein